MKRWFRWFLTTCVLGFAVGALMTNAAPGVRAHGSEARYVIEVDWTRPRIAHTYGLSYSELGLGAYRNEVETRTLGGRQCVGPDLDLPVMDAVLDAAGDDQLVRPGRHPGLVAPVHVESLPVRRWPEGAGGNPESSDLVGVPVHEDRGR